MTAHPDRELLAAYADGEPSGAEAHVESCADCRAEVDAIRRVAAGLAALPPVTMPLDVAAALDAAIEAERARPVPGGDVLPLRRRRVPGWVAGAVAASVIGTLAVGTVLRLDAGGERAGNDAGSAGGAAGAARTLRYESGFAYDPANIDAAATRLLTGVGVVAMAEDGAGAGGARSPREAAAPTATGFDSGATTHDDRVMLRTQAGQALALLATDAGLEACLAELRESPGTQPLALDYATFAGKPALLVVLPYDDDQVDVWVVGARCGLPHQATGVPDADLLHFQRITKPS